MNLTCFSDLLYVLRPALVIFNVNSDLFIFLVSITTSEMIKNPLEAECCPYASVIHISQRKKKM